MSAPVPYRFGVRFLARQNDDRSLTIINPRLLPVPLPSFGIVGLHGRTAQGPFGQEVRYGWERGEILHAVVAYYHDTTPSSPLKGRVVFERDDYPARRWLDLRYMRRSLSDVVLPILGVPTTVGTALTRAALDDRAIAMQLSPISLERALPALNEALGVSLDLIATPFYPGSPAPGRGPTTVGPASGSPPVCAWVIHPECLTPPQSEDESLTVRPLAAGTGETVSAWTDPTRRG